MEEPVRMEATGAWAADGLAEHYRSVAEAPGTAPANQEAAKLFVEAEGFLDADEVFEAERAALEVCAMYKEFGDGASYANALRLLCHCFRRQGKRAHKWIKEELGALDELGKAKLELSGADIDIDQQDAESMDRALETVQKVSRIFAKHANKRFEALAHLSLSSIYLGRRRGDYLDITPEEAEMACNEAARLFKEIGDLRGLGRAFHNLGVLLYARYDLDGAIAACREAAFAFRGLNSDTGKLLEAFELQNLALIYLAESQSDASLAEAEEALYIFRSVERKKLYEASALGTVVRACVAMQKPRKALYTAQQGLRRFQGQKGLNKEAEAVALGILLQAQLGIEDSDGALVTAEVAAEVLCELGQARKQAAMMLKVSELQLSAREDPDAAWVSAKNALRISEDLDDAEGQGRACLQIAAVNFERDQPDSGVTRAEAALQHFQRANDRKGEAEAWMALANYYFVNDDMSDAVYNSSQALPLFQMEADTQGEADAAMLRAQAQLARREPEKARAAAEEAGTLWNKLNDAHNEATALLIVAKAHLMEIKNPEFDRVSFEYEDGKRDALEAAQAALTVIGQEDPSLRATCLVLMSEVFLMDWREDEAENCVEQALSIFLQAEDFVGEATASNLKASIHISRGMYEDAFLCASNARWIFKQIGNAQGMAHTQKLLSYIRQRYAPPEEQRSESAVHAQQPEEESKPRPIRAPKLVIPQITQQAAAPLAPHVPRAPPALKRKSKRWLAKCDRGISYEVVLSKVVERLEDMGVEGVPVDTVLTDAGVTSAQGAQLRNFVEHDFNGVGAPATLIWDYPTTAEIAKYIVGRMNT